jgi:molybdate transport system substrate-binding protein
MPRRFPLSLLIALLLALPGLASAQALRIAAAASLSEAFKGIAQRFEALHPGVALSVEFGASGQLLQRAAGGAPFDVLASADEQGLRQAAPQLQAGSAQVFAHNALVLVAPIGSEAVNAPADLLRVARIAIGNPATVPVGRYAQQALNSFGLWEPLQQRLRLAADARQVLDWLLRGEVDAGLVYRSDALRHVARLRVVTELGGHEPIRYATAVLQRSRQPALAAQFVAFLHSAEARAILRRNGFSVSAAP